jgi:hypothetical protein
MAFSASWLSVRWIRCPVCQGEQGEQGHPRIDPGCRLCMGDGMVMQRLDHPRHNRPSAAGRLGGTLDDDDTPEAA